MTMTDDLVKRLRAANDESFVETLCGEAADRIEALTAERDRLASLNVELCDNYNTLLVVRSRLQDRAEAAEADNARLLADKDGLQAQIASLLNLCDGWDRERADADNGGLTMHTYGMSPDWYAEAAFWSCYGFPPNDPRAALNTGKEPSHD